MIRVESVKANIQCEGCGNYFKLSLDPGRDWPAGWDIVAMIRETLLNGSTMVGPSYQADMVLCVSCTAAADAIGDEDHLPTRAEILKATADATALNSGFEPGTR